MSQVSRRCIICTTYGGLGGIKVPAANLALTVLVVLVIVRVNDSIPRISARSGEVGSFRMCLIVLWRKNKQLLRACWSLQMPRI